MKIFNTKPAHNNFVSDGAGGLVQILKRPSIPFVSTAPPPPPQPKDAHVKYLQEYAELAATVGVKMLNEDIERFRAYLARVGITVFSLHEVVAHMDEKAKTEGVDGAGWLWSPLRDKDHIQKASFGTEPLRWWSGDEQMKNTASDFYKGPHTIRRDTNNGIREEHVGSPCHTYERIIPLQALRKIAKIEREYGPISFFVSDYAPLPEITDPDPFLMAVVNNPELRKGHGRFVIDFWEEPGFGLDKQLVEG